MQRRFTGFVVLLGLMILAQNACAEVSLSTNEDKKGAFNTLNFKTGMAVTQNGTKADITFGVETVTTSAANPGVGVASLDTLTTLVVTTEAGAAADIITLADGVAGQMKIITLINDYETLGLKIIPDHLIGATNDVLLNASGETAMFVFDGTNWNLISTTGTIE